MPCVSKNLSLLCCLLFATGKGWRPQPMRRIFRQIRQRLLTVNRFGTCLLYALGGIFGEDNWKVKRKIATREQQIPRPRRYTPQTVPGSGFFMVLAGFGCRQIKMCYF